MRSVMRKPPTAFVEEQVTLRERLYVTGAVRRDDNSAFGRNFAAVYYPKLSVSWVLSQEPFFHAPSWLSSLRSSRACVWPWRR